MDDLFDPPRTFVVTMTPESFIMVQELEKLCAQRELDLYLQAQIHLGSAESEQARDRWREVWEYVQLVTCTAYDDRIVVVLRCGKGRAPN